MDWHEGCIKSSTHAKKVHSETTKGLMKMQKEVLTVEEAAELLRLSKRSLYKLVRQGEIPGKKILNKWRLDRDALKRWLSEGK